MLLMLLFNVEYNSDIYQRYRDRYSEIHRESERKKIVSNRNNYHIHTNLAQCRQSNALQNLYQKIENKLQNHNPSKFVSKNRIENTESLGTISGYLTLYYKEIPKIKEAKPFSVSLHNSKSTI